MHKAAHLARPCAIYFWLILCFEKAQVAVPRDCFERARCQSLECVNAAVARFLGQGHRIIPFVDPGPPLTCRESLGGKQQARDFDLSVI